MKPFPRTGSEEICCDNISLLGFFEIQEVNHVSKMNDESFNENIA